LPYDVVSWKWRSFCEAVSSSNHLHRWWALARLAMAVHSLLADCGQSQTWKSGSGQSDFSWIGYLM
jgi:hypothetical protein